MNKEENAFDFIDKMINPNRCVTCGSSLIPDLESIDLSQKWDEHTYKFDCECRSGLRISIG